jgi:gluconolactonase
VVSEGLYISWQLTPRGGFTEGIEGPACDAAGNLYAVNYERQGTIGRVSPDGTCEIFVDLPEGSIGNGIRFDRSGTMFVADYTAHNVLQVNMRSRNVSVYAHEPRMNQPNDLAIMGNGLIFASDPNWAGEWGQLWRIGLDGRATLLEPSMGTTNGVEVSPDERTLYVNETVQRRIWAYDLSSGGEISNKRVLITFPDHGMDGMRCDVAGNLYVTRWGKGTVAKVSPAGEVLLEVALHGQKCTNLAFGGPDGRTIYVTVADNGNVEWFRVSQPGREWRMGARAD